MAEIPLLELKGSVEKIVFHNDVNQYTILELDTGEELITVVGTIPYASEGEVLKVYGQWTTHSNFGPQFRAEIFEHSRPETTEAMLKYLSSGVVKGIGKKLAIRIMKTFGDKALETMVEEAERLTEIKGISPEMAKEISREFQQMYGVRELMNYLGGHGIKPGDVIRVWKCFGAGSIQKIKEDPYCLCDEEIGLGFQLADKIAALAQTQNRDRLKNGTRLRAGVLFAVRQSLGNGHTCLPMQEVLHQAQQVLNVPQSLLKETIGELEASFFLYRKNIKGQDYLYLPDQFVSESFIAAYMKFMLNNPPRKITGVTEEIERIEAEKGIHYADKQREAIVAALESGILILTGGPGTGKTTTLNAIIQILQERGEEVLLAAPTGRAAKRMSELTGQEAKTIHRLLEVEWDNQGQHNFRRNEDSPLECECIVIDELSMVDGVLFEHMLRGLPLPCRMIFVGDQDQLPPVGAGNVLGDLIASKKFACVELKEIFRQAQESLIVLNAHKVVQGEMPELRKRDSDFFYMQRLNTEAAAETIVQLCSERLPASYGYSRESDIQVLCPGRKGPLGTVSLNDRLREAINPQETGKDELNIRGRLFRLGDKVMQVRNNYNLPWETKRGKRGEGVFNGDMGIIVEINPSLERLGVMVDDHVVRYDLETAYGELELAYAVTVHKSQGNEFSAVVMPVLGTSSFLCYRNLFYTAITRAKNTLVLVGSQQEIQSMVKNNQRTKRYTGLEIFLEKDEDLPAL